MQEWLEVYSDINTKYLKYYSISFSYEGETEYITAVGDVLAFNRICLKKLNKHRGFKLT